MEIQLIVFNQNGILREVSTGKTTEKVTVDSQVDWSEIINHRLNQAIHKDSIRVIGEERHSWLKEKCIYIYLADAIAPAKDYEWLDIRHKEGLEKQVVVYVRMLIELLILSSTSIQGLSDYEMTYYAGDSLFYTQKRLDELKTKGSVLKAENNMTTQELLQSIGFPLILGVLMDYFFNGGKYGISVILFFLIFSGFAFYKRKSLCFHPLSIAFAVGALGISTSFLIFNNMTLRVLNALLLPLATSAFFLSAMHPEWKSVNLSFAGPLFYQFTFKPVSLLFKLFVPFKRLVKIKKMKVNQHILQILVGLLLAIPILGIIISLLAGSDQIFNQFLTNLMRIDLPFNLDTVFEHGFIIGFLSLYFFGYLWGIKYSETTYKTVVKPVRLISTTAISTLLSLILMVYTVFTYIQLKYLFLGSVLPEGFTYADYARKGFFELVAVTLFNIFILVVSHLVTRYHSEQTKRRIKGLLSALVAYSFVLLTSGFFRMFLYERAYGFTELRLFVFFFMTFMGICLVGLMIWIWYEKTPLLKGVLICGISLYLILNYINVDAIIAYKNIHHTKGITSLDQVHLSTLSVDALKVISEDLKQHPLYEDIMLDYISNNGRELFETSSKWYDYNILSQRYKGFLKVNGFIVEEE